jgi:hypothetical protein
MVLGGFVGIAVVAVIWVAVPGVRKYEYTEAPSGAAVDDDDDSLSNTDDLRNLK